MIRFISPLVLLGCVLGLSAVPALPAEAATLTYSNLEEGIRFDYKASWSLTETKSADGLRLHMLDPLAAGAPVGRGAFTAGATIQVNVSYKQLPNGVDQELLAGAATSGNLETSGPVVVAGHSGFYVETSSDVEGGMRTRTVAFSAGSRVLQFVLATVGTSTLSVDAVAGYSADFDFILQSLQVVNPPASGVSSLSDEFLILPVAKPLIVQQGWYYHPDVGGGLHQAIDFVDTAINDPATAFTVTASAGGTATYIVGDGWNGGLGLYVQIQHSVSGTTYYTRYAHLDSSPLPVGTPTPLNVGQGLGTAGSTGLTGGYRHLHFVLYDAEWNRRDPYDIHQNRDYYPSPCGADFNWTLCPPDYFHDDDGDGIANASDLCPGTAPGAQVDANGCADAQVDADGDHVCNPGAPSGGPSGCTGSDNCPNTYNPGQENAVHPGTPAGDACEDPDGDGDMDAVDNCPNTPNPWQEDADNDDVGDVCDNCPSNWNADQADFEHDGKGDVCDLDDDNDLVYDEDEVMCLGNYHNASIRPERIDWIFFEVDDDGDTQIDEALPSWAGSWDCDGDGYAGTTENHVFFYKSQVTGDQKTCLEYDLAFPDPNQTAKPSLRWPADLVGASTSLLKIDILDITSFLAPVRYMNTNVGTHVGDVRWDLVPGAGSFSMDINIQDLTSLTVLAPPMLGGVRALNGPVCPWPG